MQSKLNIAFLWHMHQPYYRDPKTDKYVLPWVRLHGLKGYTDMIDAVHQFGGRGVTFNLVPCLLRQLSDLSSQKETDLYYDVSMKPASDLDLSEKRLLLRHFFSANHSNLIWPYPRYKQLLDQRGNRTDNKALEEVSKQFSTADFLDLQVWFNLTWFGWSSEGKYPLIAELKRKGRGFTEAEKSDLLHLQNEVLAEIIPSYRNAWKVGDIDVSMSPYYHPILPLLIDSNSATVSQPHDPMPSNPFARVEDARTQLKSGRDYFKELFGKAPNGLWPSEGSVSPAVCDLAEEVGYQWMATDENVLLATLPEEERHKIIYSSYLTSEAGVTLFFRDRSLSDAIGFRYSVNPAEQSVDDFLGHLTNIANSSDRPHEKIVAIILDGENAWEYFPDGGRCFFELLYGALQKHKKLRLTSFSKFCKKHPAKRTLGPIYPASWINTSFKIWIGDPEKNRAWNALSKTADDIGSASSSGIPAKTVEKAKKWLYIAEGSDWFWWYGKPNYSDFDSEFDYLFRANLMQAYRELNLEAPPELTRSIGEDQTDNESIVFFPIDPVIDGLESHFYEWMGARAIRSTDYSGSMNLTSSLIKRLFYGISVTHFYLRLDADPEVFKRRKLEVILQFYNQTESAISIRNFEHPEDLLIAWCGDYSPRQMPIVELKNILELKIDLTELIPLDKQINFAVFLKQNNLELERWPRENSYPCPAPSEEYINSNWVV